MIGHYHKHVSFHCRKMSAYLQPAGSDDLPQGSFDDLATFDMAKDALSLSRADSQKINSHLRVVESREANGAAAGRFSVDYHS